MLSEIAVSSNPSLQNDRLQNDGFRHSFDIGYFVLRHSSLGFRLSRGPERCTEAAIQEACFVHSVYPAAGRPRSQSEVDRSGPAARPADRVLRRQRQRQDELGAGHAVCRRATPLHREFFRVYAPVSGAAGEARGRSDRRPAARAGRHAQGHDPIQPGDDRVGHRNGRLPAPAVRQDRPRLLPGLRPRSPAPDAAKRRGAIGPVACGHTISADLPPPCVSGRRPVRRRGRIAGGWVRARHCRRKTAAFGRTSPCRRSR